MAVDVGESLKNRSLSEDRTYFWREQKQQDNRLT